MTRRRKPSPPTDGTAVSPEPAAGPSAPAPTSQMGGLALGDHPQRSPPAETSRTPAPAPPDAKRREAGPSSAAKPSSSSIAATGDPEGVVSVGSPTPSPAEERKACACCLVVIAGKIFFCSRCRLVTYCGKDCQASGGAFDSV